LAGAVTATAVLLAAGFLAAAAVPLFFEAAGVLGSAGFGAATAAPLDAAAGFLAVDVLAGFLVPMFMMFPNS
jgi:hypothetical protein